jgi:TusE/DsrC/DsvC family sulfur relay protein
MTAVRHEDGIEQRLGGIERQLQDLVEQQRAVAELFDGMAPVAKSMLRVGSERLSELERRGYVTAGREALAIVDRIVTTYGAEDFRALGDNIVGILDTVRNLTQPDVLGVANDASEAIHHAGELERLGRMGLLRSTGDEDVQRGLTIAIEVLRRIGRAPSRGVGSEPVPRVAPPRVAPPRVAPAEKPVAEASPSAPTRPTTEWEGARFYDDGFLVDAAAWTPELAEKIAAGLGVTLGDDAWKVVRWARAEFLDKGASPNVRRVATGSGAGTSALYAMFPQTPGKKIAMIAGIPKPVGCI